MKIRFRQSFRLKHYPETHFDQEEQMFLVKTGDVCTAEYTECDGVLFFPSLRSYAEVSSLLFEQVPVFYRDEVDVCSNN